MTGFYEGTGGTPQPIDHTLSSHEDVTTVLPREGWELRYNYELGIWEGLAPQAAQFATVAEMAVAVGFAVGDTVTVADYATGNNSGMLTFQAVIEFENTADGGSYIDGVGVQWKQLFSGGVVTVKQFGAVGDGTADDTAAFNAAFAYLRSYLVGGTTLMVFMTLKIPPGRFRCNSSINATDMRAYGWKVDGAGALIDSHATGKVALDMFNTRFGHISGLSVMGDATDKPAVGIAIGRDEAQTSCGGMFFSKTTIKGAFSIAGFYNYAAETSTFEQMDLTNDDTSIDSYALAQDGTYKLAVPSEFRTMPVGEVPASFNENTFTGLVARKNVSGCPIYIRRCSRHRFITGYAVSLDDAAVVMDSDGFGSDGMYYDIHCEAKLTTDPADGIKRSIRFQGVATQTHKSFTYIDHAPHASLEVFQFDNTGTYGEEAITSAKFRNSYVSIGRFSYDDDVTPLNGVFGQRTVVDYQGSIFVGDDSQFMANLNRSVIDLEIKDKTLASYGVGTQTITTESDDFKSVKGAYRFYRIPSTSGTSGTDLNIDGSTDISGALGVGFYADNDAGADTEMTRLTSNTIDDEAGSEVSELLLRTKDTGVFQIGSLTVGSGPPLHVPSSLCGLYLRTNGTATETLYVWDGSVWTAK